MVEVAKNFKTINHKSENLSLYDFKGQKVWLAFYRYASCPLCNLHINGIVQRFNEVIDAGLVFLPVFQSTPEEVRKYAGKDDLPFQIICDSNEELYNLYNVGSSFKGFASLSVIAKGVQAMVKGHMPGRINGEVSRLPSEMLINEKSEIIYRYDGKDIGDHPSLDEILINASS